MLYPVILCGGSGSRLWPLSRTLYPKQFMEYDENLPSLFTQTLQRVQHLQRNQERAIGAPIIICNEEHRFFVAATVQQMHVPGSRYPHIILEPHSRNTAPAIALVAISALADDPDATLLILPSDHILRPENTLVNAVKEAMPAVDQDFLVTFGITPDKAETGYGYIKMGEPIDKAENPQGILKNSTSYVTNFIEKPTKDNANKMLKEGGYYWNSGMFLFRADTLIVEMEKYAPDIVDICRHAWEQSKQDNDFIRPDAAVLAACPDQSIDYAVMEHTKKAAVLPLDVYWNDLGSWNSLYQSSEYDSKGNVCHGDVIAHKTRNSYIHASKRLVATLGIEDLVVVETADAVLVTKKRHAQDIKTLVKAMEAQERKEATWHQKVYRPWGYYESLVLAERFQVKRIEVKPGASLSLQMHYHRAEHWIIVSGTAEITVGEETFFLSENQSTYIPPTCKHRLKNPSIMPLVLIEIQSGAYLGEDDIERFDDNYGRV